MTSDFFRCDQKHDCDDNSDETDCDLVETPKAYMKASKKRFLTTEPIGKAFPRSFDGIILFLGCFIALLP